MGLNLDIQRLEQKSSLERQASPASHVAADFAAGAAAGAIANGDITTAKLAPGAATLPKVGFTGLKVLSAAGVAAPGAITLTGAVIGDRLIAVFGAPTAGGALAAKVPGTDFEATVTVTNQIQQVVAANLSGSTFVFILAPATA